MLFPGWRNGEGWGGGGGEARGERQTTLFQLVG